MSQKIPLSSSDFDSDDFRKVAKYISKKWPISEGKPGLSEAQNKLAKLLGYDDYHDARLSVGIDSNLVNWSADFEFDMTQRFYSLLDETISESLLHAHWDEFESFVSSLPLQHLSFFNAKAPEIVVTDEAVKTLLAAYEEAIVYHSYSEKSSLHSLPGLISYSVSCDVDFGPFALNKTIHELLSSTELPGNVIALDFLRDEIHKRSFKIALSECSSSVSRHSFHKLKDTCGFSNYKYCEELAKTVPVAALEQASINYLDTILLKKESNWVFDPGFELSKIEFDRHYWCMEHPYSFLTGEDEVESEYEEDEEFDREYDEQKAPFYAKAQKAFDFCHTQEIAGGSSEFGIYFVDTEDVDTFDFYNWIYQEKDASGIIRVLVCGIAFSQNYNEQPSAWDMMDIADMQSGTDCDSVSWTLGEYQKTLTKKYKEMDLYKIPIGKLTNGSPLVIAHRIERVFDEKSHPGVGSEGLLKAINNLSKFFDSQINLSVMIDPAQFRNNKVAPGTIKSRKVIASQNLTNYFRNKLSDAKLKNVRNMFFPIGYSDLSD